LAIMTLMGRILSVPPEPGPSPHSDAGSGPRELAAGMAALRRAGVLAGEVLQRPASRSVVSNSYTLTQSLLQIRLSR
jgi:hypothetical protein